MNIVTKVNKLIIDIIVKWQEALYFKNEILAEEEESKILDGLVNIKKWITKSI